MRYEQLVRDIRRRAGFRDDGSAAGAARAALSVLSGLLDQPERQALRKDLPEQLQPAIPPNGNGAETVDFDGFIEAMCKKEGVDAGFGLEHAEAVCRALDEHLPHETSDLLTRRLDGLWERLAGRGGAFDQETYKPLRTHASGTRSTLSDGRIGSARPLSQGSGERAQHGSVLREDNPHGRRKMSSGHPTTEDRDTLAKGRPGSKDPVSG